MALLVMSILALLLVAPEAARAQQPDAPPVEATFAFDRPDASIGDRVTLTLTVRHADDVIVDAQPPRLANVDLVSDSGPASAPNLSGGETTTFTWILQPFVLGEIDTGPVRLTWLRLDGVNGAIELPSARLTMVPARAAGDESLRALKPQATVGGAPPAWIRPAMIAGAVLATVLLLTGAVVAFRLWRIRRRQVPAVDVTPERAARNRLDALAVERYLARGNFEAYYGELALVVRGYLGARFGFNAHALTSTELEARMLGNGIDRWQARLVAGLLERCDAAVFAGRYPEPASADHDLTLAYEIVELSRPRAIATPQDEEVTV